MEDTRFDRIVRTFDALTNRRRTLSALFVGFLALHGRPDTAARKKRRKRPWCHCPDGNPVTCVTLKLSRKARRKHAKRDPFDTPGPCQAPIPGSCATDFSCPSGQACCAGLCANLQTDAANCGGCGAPCAAGESCCTGVCKNLNTDEENCGACESHCGNILTCCSGECFILGYDADHCGSCDHACPGALICCAGDCCAVGASCNIDGLCCRLPSAPCDSAGQCCSNACLPANMGIPFPHCA